MFILEKLRYHWAGPKQSVFFQCWETGRGNNLCQAAVTCVSLPTGPGRWGPAVPAGRGPVVCAGWDHPHRQLISWESSPLVHTPTSGPVSHQVPSTYRSSSYPTGTPSRPKH